MLSMKVALVTGAGKGLGRGFAEFLASRGFVVYAGLHDLADKHVNAEGLHYLELDVQSDRSITQAVKVIRKEQGRIDLLVNNAGLNKDSSTNGHKEKVTQLNTLDRHLLLKMFDVNSISPLMVVKNCISLMKTDPSFIINISSDRASFENVANDSSANYGYKASKAALNMLTRAMVFDLPENVHVIAVHPGGVHTNMNPNGSIEPRQAAQNIYGIVQNWNPKLNGRFVHSDGSEYAC